MRIAYVCHYDAFLADGVVEKISTQTAEWRLRGHGVEVFCLSPPAAGRRPALAARVFPFAGLRQRIGATRKLDRAVRAHQPDCIYMRGDLYLPPLSAMLRSAPSAVEINGDLNELRLDGRPRGAVWYARFSYAAMARSAGGLVFVTNEFARSPIFQARGTPRVVIANGADARRVSQLPAPRNERARVVMLVGAVLPWQGIDKFLWLAEQMPEADFDLLGPSPGDLPAAPPANVTMHGMLSAADYEPILASCDVGIGQLALHRRQASENSPLKVRTYLLAGLPVILAYEDTDFLDEDPWYILKISNTESNVRDELERIRSFVESSRGRRAPREELAARLGAAAKEAERLRFFERLVAERRS